MNDRGEIVVLLAAAFAAGWAAGWLAGWHTHSSAEWLARRWRIANLTILPHPAGGRPPAA